MKVFWYLLLLVGLFVFDFKSVNISNFEVLLLVIWIFIECIDNYSKKVENNIKKLTFIEEKLEQQYRNLKDVLDMMDHGIQCELKKIRCTDNLASIEEKIEQQYRNLKDGLDLMDHGIHCELKKIRND